MSDRSIEDLIEASSLGTPEAKVLRDSVSAEQVRRGGETPGLEGQLGQLRALDAVQVDHDAAETADGELHLEDLRSLAHQRRLLDQRLLQAHGAGRLPQVAEGPPLHLEPGVAGVPEGFLIRKRSSRARCGKPWPGLVTILVSTGT